MKKKAVSFKSASLLFDILKSFGKYPKAVSAKISSLLAKKKKH